MIRLNEPRWDLVDVRWASELLAAKLLKLGRGLHQLEASFSYVSKKLASKENLFISPYPLSAFIMCDVHCQVLWH